MKEETQAGTCGVSGRGGRSPGAAGPGRAGRQPPSGAGGRRHGGVGSAAPAAEPKPSGLTGGGTKAAGVTPGSFATSRGYALEIRQRKELGDSPGCCGEGVTGNGQALRCAAALCPFNSCLPQGPLN